MNVDAWATGWLRWEKQDFGWTSFATVSYTLDSRAGRLNNVGNDINQVKGSGRVEINSKLTTQSWGKPLMSATM